MNYDEKIVDRQVGRNADLFARTIGEMPTIEERYPYIRILISIIEQAHPEWNQAPTRDSRIARLVFHMSKGAVNQEETAEIVRLRDEERGFSYIERKPEAEKKSDEAASEKAPAVATGATTEGAATGEAPAPTTDAANEEAPAPSADAANEEAPAPTTDAANEEAPAPTADAATGEAPAPTTDAANEQAPAPTTDAATGEAPAPTADAANEEAPAPTPRDDTRPPEQN
jgi:hypothetical protein